MLGRPAENAKAYGEGDVNRDVVVCARVERHLCICFQSSLLCIVVYDGVGLLACVLCACANISPKIRFYGFNIAFAFHKFALIRCNRS